MLPFTFVKLLRFLALFLSAAAYGSVISTIHIHSSIATTNEDPIDRVVLIGPYNEPKGTGYLVTPDGHILTAAHVIGKNNTAEIRFRSKVNSVTARIVKVNRYLDLALLKISPESLPSPLVFSEQLPEIGGKILLIGHHQNGGIVERLKSLAKSVQGLSSYGDIEIEGSVRPGFSGGPALHPNGTIAGINLRNDVTGVTYVLPSREILGFLAGIKYRVSEMGAKRESIEQASTTGISNLLREINELNSRITKLEKRLGSDDQLQSQAKPSDEIGVSNKLAANVGPLYVSVQSLRLTRSGIYLTLIYENRKDKNLYFALYGGDNSGSNYYEYPTYMIDDARNEFRVVEAVGIGGLYYKLPIFVLSAHEKRTVSLKFRPTNSISSIGSSYSFISATAIVAQAFDGKPKLNRYYYSIEAVHNFTINGIKATE